MRNSVFSYAVLALLFSVKTDPTTEKPLPQKIETETKTATPEEHKTCHQRISLLYAFMTGKVRAQQDQTIHYSHYDQPQAHYTQSIQEVHETLHTLHNLMIFIHMSWMSLPIELEISRIAKTRSALIAKLSTLTEEEKTQLEVIRFHEYMKNTDLEENISEKEKAEIIANRDALKKAFHPKNASTCQWQKINAAAARKLNPNPMPNISEHVKEIIAAIKND